MQKVQPGVHNMALLCNFPISIPYLNSNKYNAIIKIPISSKLIINYPKVSNFNKSYLCLKPFNQICLFSSGNSSSLTEPNEEDFSTSIIFVKGLPLSTSEGRLEMVFGSYGEVSKVKILSDKKTREPLGFAYIWFSSPASAQTAVKEMNGELFDGRFISVMIARPGSCMPRPRSRPLKF